MKHDYYEREDGLCHCKVCNGAEGSLPTDCPGECMPADIEDRVYKGHLDFRNGRWWASLPLSINHFGGES